MMLFGAFILTVGLFGIGFAKRNSARKGSPDGIGYVLGAMFVGLGVFFCWGAAGAWLLEGSGWATLFASGLLIVIGTIFAIWSFAITDAEFDKP